MSNVLGHRFVSPKLDGADLTQVQPSAWNDGHQFKGGNDGDLLTRSTGDATFGAAWLARDTLIPPITAYTPVWRAAGVAVPIGNGTLTGYYQQIGKMTYVQFHLVFGNTTPGPTGAWTISLPFAPFEGLTSLAGIAYTGNVYQVLTHSIGLADLAIVVPGSPMQAVTNNVPFVWGPGHHLSVGGFYRAA